MDGLEKLDFQIEWLDDNGKFIERTFIKKIDLTRAISTACFRLMHNTCPSNAAGFIVRRKR